jgi:hypothetical protein
MTEQTIRAYWQEFLAKNNLGSKQAPRTLETLFLSIHKAIGRRVTDAEVQMIEARLRDMEAPEKPQDGIEF